MKKIVLIFGLLLCAVSGVWGACITGSWDANQCGGCYRFNEIGCGCRIGQCGSTMPSMGSCGVNQICDKGTYFFAGYTIGCACGGNNGWYKQCYAHFTLMCDTKAEADSATIAQNCTSGTIIDSTINSNKEYFCQNGSGDSYLTFGFYNFNTGAHGDTLTYWIKTSTGYEGIDEATYNHLAALACVDIALYRGVLNGKYVYWYSNEQEPAGVINVVRIK